MQTLRRDPNGMVALLRQACVTDHQKGVLSPDVLVGLNSQFRLKRTGIPNAIRNEMMQAAGAFGRKAFCHRPDTLAITRTDHPRIVDRAHLSPLLVTKLLNEWLKPVRQRNIQLRHLAHPDESAQDPQIIVNAELISQSSAGMKIIGQMGARCFKVQHAPPQC